MSNTIIEAYVTNLGKYNEGQLVGEFLKLPASKEDVQALLKRIGIDGREYEEIFITNYECEIYGLSDCLSEYSQINELNYLTALIAAMDEGERKKFEAAIECGEHTGSIKDVINLTQNLDCCELHPDIHDDGDLGWYYINELGVLEVPENIKAYIDFEQLGRDISLDEIGAFTDKGYFTCHFYGGAEPYDGWNVPQEYRIFACPNAA